MTILNMVVMICYLWLQYLVPCGDSYILPVFTDSIVLSCIILKPKNKPSLIPVMVYDETGLTCLLPKIPTTIQSRPKCLVLSRYK